MVLWLDVLDTLESLLSPLKLLLSPGEFVQELTLVKLKLLHSIFHLGHFLGLIIYDVANALLDVDLLSVGVQVTRDGIEELQSLVSRFLQFSLLTKEIVELGSGLSDFSC